LVAGISAFISFIVFDFLNSENKPRIAVIKNMIAAQKLM
jgi:hypothetical protein